MCARKYLFDGVVVGVGGDVGDVVHEQLHGLRLARAALPAHDHALVHLVVPQTAEGGRRGGVNMWGQFVPTQSTVLLSEWKYLKVEGQLKR